MKNLSKALLVLIFIPTISFAQEVRESIYASKYGHIYEAYREISKEDFVRKCNNREVIGIENFDAPSYMSSNQVSVSKFLEHMSNPASVNTKGFAYSYIHNAYDTKYQYLDELVNEVRTNRQYCCPQHSWDICSEKCYDFIQLYLDKFEIILTYNKNLQKYDKEIREQQKNIRESYTQVDKKMNVEKTRLQNKKQEDTELNKLKADKRKAVSEINSNFDNKIEQIELQKQGEIKGLQMSNYAENKRKIINKYEPKISALKKQKGEDVQSAKLFWDDKIKTREKEVEKIIADEISALEKNKLEMRSSQRQEIKSQNNLNQKRKDMETNYQNGISEINEKIKVLLEKK